MACAKRVTLVRKILCQVACSQTRAHLKSYWQAFVHFGPGQPLWASPFWWMEWTFRCVWPLEDLVWTRFYGLACLFGLDTRISDGVASLDWDSGESSRLSKLLFCQLLALSVRWRCQLRVMSSENMRRMSSLRIAWEAEFWSDSCSCEYTWDCGILFWTAKVDQ